MALNPEILQQQPEGSSEPFHTVRALTQDSPTGPLYEIDTGLTPAEFIENSTASEIVAKYNAANSNQ